MWDQIEADFGGDETANFGPREEKGTALFQIDTVATVSCSDLTNTLIPPVASSVLGDLTCLSVQKNLLLHTATVLRFDHAVDVVEWSPDGSLVIVGDSAGVLYVLSAKSEEIIFSYNLMDAAKKVGDKCFKKILFTDTSDLVILTTDGQLFVQSGLEAFQREGGNIAELIQRNVFVTDTNSQHTTVNDVVILGDFIYTVGEGPSLISVWSYRSGSIQLVDEVESFLMDTMGTAIIQAMGTTDGNYLVALDSNRFLSLWNAHKLMCVRSWTEFPVVEICLLEGNISQNNSMQDMKLVLLTAPEDGVCHLKVQNLPQFETVYQLQLGTPSMVAKCSTFQESLYISEFCRNSEKPDVVSSMRFRCLTETDPETRLYKILNKNKFEEAEKFANYFQLNVELVHKVKANYLIDELSPWNVGKYSEDQISQMTDQFWSCLDTIADDLHVAEKCLGASLPSLSGSQALLTYCRKRLDKIYASLKDPTEKDKHQILLTKAMEKQHRLTTFELAFSKQEFSGERWEQFCQANLLGEALEQISNRHLDSGFTIWIRHQGDWVNGMVSVEMVQQVLACIPYDIPLNSLHCYLTTGLIPTVVREAPEALASIVSFITEKTVSMENVEKETWPKRACNFASSLYSHLCKLTEVLTDETYVAHDSVNKMILNCDVVLAPLQTLIIKLQQLDAVLHKYKCRLSLAQFLQETCETIVFRMLDKVVALELIIPTLEKQIQPYMREHQLKQDQIFSKYIKDLLERSHRIRSYVEETPWEAKACAIIDCIKNPEQKVEGILEVVRYAPIPWTKGIEALVQSGLKLKHPKVSKLKDECDLLNVKKLIRKYCNKNIGIPQGQDALRLIYAILTKDQEGCVEDAVEVMRSCGLKAERDLYCFRMRQLILAERLEEAVILLQSLPLDLCSEVGNSILTLTFIILNDTIVFPGLEERNQQEKQHYAMAGVHIARYLRQHVKGSLLKEELEEQEKLLKNLLALQVEFGQYLTQEEYEDKGNRLAIMEKYVMKFYSKDGQSLKYGKVYRLADILQIPHTTLLGQLVVRSIHTCNIDAAITFSRELCDSSRTAECAETLYEVVQVLLHLLADVEEGEAEDVSYLRQVPDICDMMACKAVTICSGDNILRCLELCKRCSLLKSVSQQCEPGDSGLPVMGGFEDYSVDMGVDSGLGLDFFEEDAMLMNSTVALPLVAKYTVVNPFCNQNTDQVEKEKTDESTAVTQCNAVLPVVQHLKTNSHLQLAYSFSFHMLNEITQNTHQMDMGLPIQSQAQKEKTKLEKINTQDLIQNSQTLIRDLVTNIVMKIFNAAKPDIHLALTYMSTRPLKEIHDVMMRLTKSAGQKYKRLQAIAHMGIALGQLKNDPKSIMMCQALELNASWGYRLGKMKIPFKDVFYAPMSEKKKLLPVIAQNEAADSTLVKEYCRSFELPVDDGLLLYIDHLIVAPEDSMQEGTGLCKMNALTRARQAVQAIQDKITLAARLENMFYKINSYDYETLEFLLEELQKSGETSDIPVEKGLKLLEYLRAYIRQEAPTDYEMEYKPGGEKKELMIESLPAESKTRLPFHPMLQGNPWKIVTPELKKETIPVWVLVAKLLNLSQDQICLTAVQNMVRSYAETFTSPDGGSDLTQWNWSKESANHQLLKDAQAVLALITNCESSLACAKWMVNKLPLGSEKVIVLQSCCDLAELWHRELPEDSGKKNRAKTAYIKFMTHWQRMASAEVLCLHGLGEEELLQQTDKPNILLQKLYEHKSVSQRQTKTGYRKPDIHAAAEALAKINQIDLSAVKLKLMEKWLQSSGSQSDVEETMTFSLENLKFEEESSTDTNDSEDVNYRRIVHLLKSGNLEENVTSLLSSALQPEEGSNMASRILALRCILHLGDDILRNVCGKSAQDISEMIRIMNYLVRLERLHIRHTVETFHTCNKEGLVRGIWRNHNHEKTAVALVSCICLDYKLYDKKLWNSILQKLVAFNLLKQLEFVLLQLVAVSEIWSVLHFSKAWQYLITSTLDKVSSPLSDEQVDKLVHYFNLLISCPLLRELDITHLSELYKKLELWACSLGCLLLAGNKINQSIQQLGCKGVLESVTQLQEHGLSQRVATLVKECVYSFVLEKEKFGELLEGVYLQEFVLFCVRHKTVLPVIQFAIQNNRINEAKKLFSAYSSHHQDILMKLHYFLEDEKDEDDTILMHLKAYLKMNDMADIAALLN